MLPFSLPLSLSHRSCNMSSNSWSANVWTFVIAWLFCHVPSIYIIFELGDTWHDSKHTHTHTHTSTSRRITLTDTSTDTNHHSRLHCEIARMVSLITFVFPICLNAITLTIKRPNAGRISFSPIQALNVLLVVECDSYFRALFISPFSSWFDESLTSAFLITNGMIYIFRSRSKHIVRWWYSVLRIRFDAKSKWIRDCLIYWWWWRRRRWRRSWMKCGKGKV